MKELLTLTAAVVGAVVLAGPALADVSAVGQIRPDDRSGILRPTGPPGDAGPNTPIRPDDRPVAGLSNGSPADGAQNLVPLRPDDRRGARGTGPAGAPGGTSLSVRISAAGFDWGDAGIGAAAGVGFLLLMLGLSLLIRHARFRPRSA
jgi:hypothetical protein